MAVVYQIFFILTLVECRMQWKRAVPTNQMSDYQNLALL